MLRKLLTFLACAIVFWMCIGIAVFLLRATFVLAYWAVVMIIAIILFSILYGIARKMKVID